MNWTCSRVAALSLALAAGAVGHLPAAGPDAVSAVPANPTFTKDILPIFQHSCQACHRPGQMAPFSLLTYTDARPWARSIKEKVESRYMPPWHLDRTVGHFDPDPSLSDEQIATISRWVTQGAPQGDPRDAPAPIAWPDRAWTFGDEPDIVATASGAAVPATGPDLYITSEAASGLTEDRYIRWMQVVPEHTTIVHHAIVTAVQGDSPRGSLLANYARGGDGDIYTEASGTAKLLKAGATISFQDHLHPDGEHAVVEHTKIGIKFFPKGYVPKHLIQTQRIGSQSTLAIPPGEANARSDAYFQLAQPARIVSVFPHMHYRGRRMTVEAIPPNGQPQLLIDVNRFVWTWQLTYAFKEPLPTFPKGTMIHVTAYHDNSAANKENPDPSAFVGWGDRTIDEMNIGNVDFYYLTDEEYAELNAGAAGSARRGAGR